MTAAIDDKLIESSKEANSTPRFYRIPSIHSASTSRQPIRQSARWMTLWCSAAGRAPASIWKSITTIRQ